MYLCHVEMLVFFPQTRIKSFFLSPSSGFFNNTFIVSGYIKAVKMISILHEAPTSLHLEGV